MSTGGGGIWLGTPGRDDSRRMLEVMAAPGPVGGGGTFFVDPERAEECIRALRAVAVDLAAAELLTGQAYFPSPGADEVSVNAATQAGIMANRATHFIATWRNQLEQTAGALAEQLAAYREADQAYRERLA